MNTPSMPAWPLIALCAVSFATAARGDAPAGRYTIDAGIVTDTVTKLNWQQATSDTFYTWPDATAYCQGLTLSGGGWRLPELRELLSLVDPTRSHPAIDDQAFPGVPTVDDVWFWTASPHARTAGEALGVNFADGFWFTGDSTYPNHVRCVR